MSTITLTGGRVSYASNHDTQFVEFIGPDFHILAGFNGPGEFTPMAYYTHVTLNRAVDMSGHGKVYARDPAHVVSFDIVSRLDTITHEGPNTAPFSITGSQGDLSFTGSGTLSVFMYPVGGDFMRSYSYAIEAPAPDIVHMPEPATAVLLATGLILAALWKTWRRVWERARLADPITNTPVARPSAGVSLK